MNLFQKKTEKQKTVHMIALKGGAYSLTLTIIVLAILVVINIMASVLPATLTKLDISSSKLYSITSNTKVVVNALDQDVTIYWIVQNDKEDSVIENLLEKYDSLSEHIDIVKKNPDTYPTFASQYTSETVANNSLIVECGEKSRYISYNDLYLSDIDYTTYSQVYSFDGEGAITSAIDFVVSEELPKIYVLEGHGEKDLPEAFEKQIEKENMELTQISLLNENEIPEEADCILIYAPSTDISEEEKEILTDYAESGGKLLVFAGTTEDGTLENLYGLLNEYGISVADGIVIEDDRDHYAFQAPYILLPEIQSHSITDSLIEANYYVIVPLAQGLVTDHTQENVTELLKTSDTAFSKIDGYALTTYEKEETDIDGSFSLAVSVETENEGQMIWISSSDFLDEMYNAYSSGANLDFSMNALSSLIGESEAVAIRSKSMGYNYLTISDTTASMLKTMMIGVLPGMFVVCGISMVVIRRRKRNEQV